MSSIVTFESIANELSVDPNGVSRVTIRGAARVCGVDESAIRRNLVEGADFSMSKMAEALTGHGFTPADFLGFIRDGIPDTALAIIIQYYAFEAGRRCTAQARAACKAFMTIGLRSLVWKIKGFDPVQGSRESDVRAKLAEVQELLLSRLLDMVKYHSTSMSTRDLTEALTEIRKHGEPVNGRRTIEPEFTISTIVPGYPDEKLIKSLKQVSSRIGWVSPGVAKNSIYALRRDNNLNLSRIESILERLAAQGIGKVSTTERTLVWRYN